MPVRRTPPPKNFHVVFDAEGLTDDDLDYEYDEADIDPEILEMLKERSEAPLIAAASVEEACRLLGLTTIH